MMITTTVAMMAAVGGSELESSDVQLSDLEILSLEMKNFHLQQQSLPVSEWRGDDGGQIGGGNTAAI